MARRMALGCATIAFAKLKREGKTPAVTYAHIARQKGRPGLAIQ